MYSGEEMYVQGFGGKNWGKETTWKNRRRWENNIKTGIAEVRWEGLELTDLAQDRDSWPALVNAVMNFRVPWNAQNFLTTWGPVSFSRRTVLHVVSLLLRFVAMLYQTDHLFPSFYDLIYLTTLETSKHNATLLSIPAPFQHISKLTAHPQQARY